MAKKSDIQLVKSDGTRLDGRSPTDLRPLKITAGVLKQANGSALVEWGRNKVLAAVYGPRECFPKMLTNPYRAAINARYLMAPFSGNEEHSRSGPNRRSQEISKVIQHVFENLVLTEQFPKTMIDICIEVLQSDGGTRIAAVTAASVALADAGIPMRDLACGVGVGKASGQLLADLDKGEDNFGESDIPTVISPRTGELLLYQMDGMLTREEISRGFDLATEACMKVHAKQVEALKKKYDTVLEEAGSNGE
ncbi:MAG: exosome complex exonuclease Rrp41 [Candidatus Micrarchaeia archaeon]